MITQDTTAGTQAWGSSSAAGTQDGFAAAVLAVTARAKAALPEAASRIDTAAAWVLAGEVELLEEGRTARVGRSADGDAASVVQGQCSCADFPTAPGHFCTHRLAYSIAKRATEVSQTHPTPLTTPRDQALGGLCDPCDADPEEATEGGPSSSGMPTRVPGERLPAPRDGSSRRRTCN